MLHHLPFLQPCFNAGTHLLYHFVTVVSTSVGSDNWYDCMTLNKVNSKCALTLTVNTLTTVLSSESFNVTL